jgi:predicted transcriptional regulator
MTFICASNFDWTAPGVGTQVGRGVGNLKAMEANLSADVEKKLQELATQSGRRTDELLRDALAGYLDELVKTRDTLNSRYDDLKSGRVKPIDGEEAFVHLQAKTDAQRNPST